jgi:hypothetical protein
MGVDIYTQFLLVRQLVEQGKLFRGIGTGLSEDQTD